MKPSPAACTKLISADKHVVVGPTGGSETLASATDLFGYISPDFTHWGCDKAEPPTGETLVDVYEQTEDATYPEIFGSIGQNPERLTLTTPQIKSFMANNAKEYLLEAADWTCFRFLFTANGELFVADARVLSNGSRDLRVTRFTDGSVRHATYRHRIVVPRPDTR